MGRVTAEVSVAVVSFNTRDLTLRCVAAAEAAAAGADARLTLVDNGSSDGTVEAVRRAHPAWDVLVAPENPGYGAALNRAFAAAPGTCCLALNADVLLRADTLRLLREFLDRHPQCGLAGPTLAYPDERPQPSCKRFPGLGFALGETLWLHALWPGNPMVRRFYYAGGDPTTLRWVDAVSGAAMLIRGEAFRRVGGFDEGFRMYFEETDLCLRLHGAGYRVGVCPEAKAVHWHGASTIQTSARQVEYYLSYVRFFRKHRGPGAAAVLAAAVALSTLLRMLALPLKYPPLSRARAGTLRAKLAAARRLLRELRRAATGLRPVEVQPSGSR